MPVSHRKGTLITVSEAAKRKGVGRSRIYQLIDAGRLETFMGEDAIKRVRAEDVDALRPLPPGPRRKD